MIAFPLLVFPLIVHCFCREYIDDDGVIRGPFTTQQIDGWWKQAYFQPQLQIRQQGDQQQQWRNIQDVWNDKQENDNQQQQTMAQTKQETDQTVSTTAMDTPAMTSTETVSHPSPTHSDDDDSVASSSPEDDVTFDEDDIAPDSKSGNVSSLSVWYYLDDDQQEQGPYSGQQMEEWRVANFFNQQTKCRTADETEHITYGQRQQQGKQLFVPNTTITPKPTNSMDTAERKEGPAASTIASTNEEQWYYIDNAGTCIRDRVFFRSTVFVTVVTSLVSYFLCGGCCLFPVLVRLVQVWSKDRGVLLRCDCGILGVSLHSTIVVFDERMKASQYHYLRERSHLYSLYHALLLQLIHL